MTTNCARTCDVCDTTSSSTSTCSDIATNCAVNSNLCTNSVYRTLMLQQCCATCSGTSSSSTSCVDSSSSCTNWVANGFCSNSFYTTAQKQSYCARSCNLCWEDSRRRPTQWSSLLAPSSLVKMNRVLLNNTDRFLRSSNSNGRRIDLTWTDLND